MLMNKCNALNRKLFMATQFLTSMTKKDVPNISEVNDLFNAIKMGAYGIQLSEETAIGKYPVKCVEIIKSLYNKAKDKR